MTQVSIFMILDLGAGLAQGRDTPFHGGWRRDAIVLTDHHKRGRLIGRNVRMARIRQHHGCRLRKVVAAKVSAEGLTQIQTTEIARAYHDAPTPEVKRKIIESPILSSDTSADILRRSIARAEVDKIRATADKKAKVGQGDEEDFSRQDFGLAVKEFLDAMQQFRTAAHKVVNIVKHGRYSRATLRYAVSKLEETMGELISNKDYLESVE